MPSSQQPELQRFAQITPNSDSYVLNVSDVEHEYERETIAHQVNGFLRNLETTCLTPDTPQQAWEDLAGELNLGQGKYKTYPGDNVQGTWRFKVPVADAGKCVLASLETMVTVRGATWQEQSDEFRTALDLVHHRPLEVGTKYRERHISISQLLGVEGQRTRLLFPRYDFSDSETYAALRAAVGRELLRTSGQNVNARVRFCTETMDPLKNPIILGLFTYNGVSTNQLTPPHLVMPYMAQVATTIRASHNA